MRDTDLKPCQQKRIFFLILYLSKKVIWKINSVLSRGLVDKSDHLMYKLKVLD